MTIHNCTEMQPFVFTTTVSSSSSSIGLKTTTDAGFMTIPVGDQVRDDINLVDPGTLAVTVQVLNDGANVMSVSDDDGGTWVTFPIGGNSGKQRTVPIPEAEEDKTEFTMTIVTGTSPSQKTRSQKVIIRHRIVAGG